MRRRRREEEEEKEEEEEVRAGIKVQSLCATRIKPCALLACQLPFTSHLCAALRIFAQLARLCAGNFLDTPLRSFAPEFV